MCWCVALSRVTLTLKICATHFPKIIVLVNIRSCDASFDISLNKPFNKLSSYLWFDTTYLVYKYFTWDPNSDIFVCTWGPFYKHGLTFISARISNYIYHKMWDEITCPFRNFNCAIAEVCKWIGNYIPLFTGYAIVYPCADMIIPNH